MAKHTVTLSDATWDKAQDVADEADTDTSDVIETILADRLDDADYIDDVFGELEEEEEED